MSKPANRKTDQQACRQMDNFGNTYIHADTNIHAYIFREEESFVF